MRYFRLPNLKDGEDDPDQRGGLDEGEHPVDFAELKRRGVEVVAA